MPSVMIWAATNSSFLMKNQTKRSNHLKIDTMPSIIKVLFYQKKMEYSIKNQHSPEGDHILKYFCVT